MEIIKVNNLVKYYKNFLAVDRISFKVNEGELFAFLGENGAGKSTSINILCTVLSKTSGEVYIDGLDIDKDKEEIKKRIGIVFQGSILDNVLTVKENLMSRCAYYGYSKRVALNRIEELKEELELEDIMNKRYESLSGGQRRRVDIARALIHKPKLLFLDEPTTGLDPKTRRMVWDIINGLRKENNLTVFLTTHYMEETKDADYVVILDHGHIAAEGSPNKLKNQYTCNKLIWHTEDNTLNQELLNKYKLDYTYNLDSYRINYKNNESIIDFLSKEREFLKDYELIKGNMDDVFLNVTGRSLD
ncbi:multidrug/hemolysin transport system ATP-binding protein [Anaeroplasma bactoclasticum]|jgi:multidrug/hemolysin transport system ATP-binding protein|uniref:Multidrug/hemolysin transport system ATP-binding protein n=1 Tax=Anaeroplasma bactoclasticum TaxID=2088 RepID=A0A397RYT5_9MOLU|nr:ABC transporter ATP-binding protein [Anaeroplasma bactoclasticum]RIA77726.1 multidrug/hemolysin transport system ATP-binding protein [Anaeroplasma bactoclasticum]